MAECSNHGKPVMNWRASDLSKEWQRFKQHCTFTFKGPLANKSEVEKVNYLMTYIGDKGREIYGTLTWAPATGHGDNAVPAENDTLAGVYAKYDAYVAPKRNCIRATVTFNRRKQESTERFDNFVTSLKVLVKDCGYGATEDRMVRDAIVLRSLHPQVQEKCLEKGDELTLEMAINLGQNHEVSHESMKVINEEDSKVNVVKHNISKNGQKNRDRKYEDREMSKSWHKSHFKKREKIDISSARCPRCGYKPNHPKSKCPARDEVCRTCKLKGHYAKVCRNKTYNIEEVSTYSSDESDSSKEYAHLIHSVSQKGAGDWWENIMIDGVKARVQIDTGAAQSLLSYELFKTLKTRDKLAKSDKKFKSYTDHRIEPIGCLTVTTSYKERSAEVKFYVVKSTISLLSGEASKQLGLIERIHVIDEIDKYPELKSTTGMLPGTYSLRIDPTVPPVVHGPRRQPQAIVPRVKEKLKEMESAGHIIKVTEPTDWVSSMVVVIKKEKIRICIDPKDLNRAIRRENYPIPTVEEIVSTIPNAKVFSVIDAKSGFLQIKLDYESSLLTTFNTPVGRYRWLRLPFGIKSAPEIYQRIMDTMLEGIDGARAVMDDILIAAETPAKHDIIMKQVVRRAHEWNLKLNFEKCHLKQSRVKYIGHVVTSNGLEPDPDKVKAVMEYPVPQNKEEIRRFLGIIQYLAKFIPDLSAVDKPIRDVMKKDVDFHWDKAQEQSLKKLKELCCSAPVLTYYDPVKELRIQCDASSYALGGVLLQEGHPVAYTSRALTSAERNYAQIEKEMLAIVHCCKKFHHYIFGREVVVESDHKPLQAIYTKPLLAAPMRLQSMLLKLQPYDMNIVYKPGKDLLIGDALSRANLPDATPDIQIELVNMVDYIAVTSERYKDFQQSTARELNELHVMIHKGWPDTKQEVPHSIRPYWSTRDELSAYDGIVYKGQRIVVPPSMRPNMLLQIHESHLGIVKCKQRAREALFWPGMSQQIEDAVNDCELCNTYQSKQQKETLRPTKTPNLPWVEVASDIMEWEKTHYLVTVDYFSKFIEVDRLDDLSSSVTIEMLKSQMARHGIPEKLRTDNGPQFDSQEFMEFCADYGIEQHTSSPRYPQSNGEAERAVQTVKRLWTKAHDKQLALLAYRTTPMESCGMSPAQLSMSRRLRSKIPIARELLKPKLYDMKAVIKELDNEKERQRHYYDAKVKSDLPVLVEGDPVRMAPFPGKKQWVPAKVIGHHHSPRSYVVEYNGRKYRRNRKHLHLSTYRAYDRGISSKSVSNGIGKHDHIQAQSNVVIPANTTMPTVTMDGQPILPTAPATPKPGPRPEESIRSSPKKCAAEMVTTRSGRVSNPPKRLITE